MSKRIPMKDTMMIFDDTYLFTNKPNLGVDYMIVVDCGAGGVFKCGTKEGALKAIKDASHRFFHWKAGQLKKIKRAYNKRLRKFNKGETK